MERWLDTLNTEDGDKFYDRTMVALLGDILRISDDEAWILVWRSLQPFNDARPSQVVQRFHQNVLLYLPTSR